MSLNEAVDRTMDTVEFVVDKVDARVGPILAHAEQEVGYTPVRVAAWGLAAASVLGAVAAGFGAVAAVAGAYLAVRSAIRASRAVPESMEPLYEPLPRIYPEPAAQEAAETTEQVEDSDPAPSEPVRPE